MFMPCSNTNHATKASCPLITKFGIFYVIFIFRPFLLRPSPFYPGWVVVGAVYSAIAKTNGLPILVFMVREIADCAFYKIAMTLGSHRDNARRNAKIYAVTNLMINAATLMVLYRLQLIAIKGIAIFAALMSVELACKFFDLSKYRTWPA